MTSHGGLLSACESGNVKTVLDVLAQPRERWADQLQSGLFQAVWNRHSPIVGHLLDHGAKINDATFRAAIRGADNAVFAEFLSHGFDVNSTEFGEPALRLSVAKPDFMRFLLERGADPNITNGRGVSALATAAILPMSPALDVLISFGAKLDPDILHRAMRPTASGGPDMVRYLLGRGADVSHVSADHGTPLHYAAYLDLKDAARLLLDAGADPNFVVDGCIPADLAKREGYMEMYRILTDNSGSLAE